MARTSSSFACFESSPAIVITTLCPTFTLLINCPSLIYSQFFYYSHKVAPVCSVGTFFVIHKTHMKIVFMLQSSVTQV
jgi:hypothetical protein